MDQRVSASRTNFTLSAGRYSFQAEAEKLIPSDVIAKLQPLPSSRFLEIGCGPGLLLAAITPLVAEAVGIDSEDQIELARTVTGAHLIVGDFNQITLDRSFDRVLIYSVIHSLPNIAAVRGFLEKAAALLPSGGRLLVGDIPNADTRAAYIASPSGRVASEEWQARIAETSAPRASGDRAIGALSNQSLLDLMAHFRSLGFLTYHLPQPRDLPFGNTREDLLILKP